MEELQGHGGCTLCLFECILEAVAALWVFIKLMELSCRQPWLEGSHNTTATHNVWCWWHASIEVHLVGAAAMCRLHRQCWSCCVRSKKLGREGGSHINLLITTPKTRWSCALCLFKCILEDLQLCWDFIHNCLSCLVNMLGCERSHNTTITLDVWCYCHTFTELYLGGVAALCRLHRQRRSCCVIELDCEGGTVNNLLTTPKTRWSCWSSVLLSYKVTS